MTDGEISQVRGWINILAQALAKVQPGSEKYIFYTGIVLGLGAILALQDKAVTSEGASAEPYLTNMRAVISDIRGFGVKLIVPNEG